MASTARAAIGSQSFDQTGSVASTHSDRLHAWTGGCRWAARGVLQPQVSEPERFGDLAAVVSENARVALGGEGLPRDVLGEVPVDRAALPGHQVGELAQCIGELLRVAERSQRPASAAGAGRPDRQRRPPARATADPAPGPRPRSPGRPKPKGGSVICAGLSGRMEGSRSPRYPGSSAGVSNRDARFAKGAASGSPAGTAAGPPASSRGYAQAARPAQRNLAPPGPRGRDGRGGGARWSPSPGRPSGLGHALTARLARVGPDRPGDRHRRPPRRRDRGDLAGGGYPRPGTGRPAGRA